MIRLARGRAAFTLSRKVYTKHSLSSAALALQGRAEVLFGARRSAFDVELRPARALSRPALRALAGDFMNEALNQAYRQRVIRAGKALSAPLLAHLRAVGFPRIPEDPLEMLEPQVAEDRARESADLLLEAARR